MRKLWLGSRTMSTNTFVEEAMIEYSDLMGWSEKLEHWPQRLTRYNRDLWVGMSWCLLCLSLGSFCSLSMDTSAVTSVLPPSIARMLVVGLFGILISMLLTSITGSIVEFTSTSGHTSIPGALVGGASASVAILAPLAGASHFVLGNGAHSFMFWTGVSAAFAVLAILVLWGLKRVAVFIMSETSKFLSHVAEMRWEQVF
jgi:hypothetical protein